MKFQKMVEKSCFADHEGSFFAYISTSRYPTLSWEGKWSQNFSNLKTQIVDPTGAVFEYNPLEQIEKKLGPRGLRSLMCGQTAFLKRIKIDGHKIKVKGRIKSFPLSSSKTRLETKSEFDYGLFGTKNDNILFWQGIVQDRKITPSSMRFLLGSDVVAIEFIDYE